MATRQIVTFSFLTCLLQLVVSMVLPDYCALCFTRLIIGWFRVWGRFCQFLKMASKNTKTVIYSLASKYTPGLPKPAPVLNNIYVGNLKTELSGVFDTGASDAYGRCQDYRYSGPRCRGSSQGSHLFWGSGKDLSMHFGGYVVLFAPLNPTALNPKALNPKALNPKTLSPQALRQALSSPRRLQRGSST